MWIHFIRKEKVSTWTSIHDDPEVFLLLYRVAFIVFFFFRYVLPGWWWRLSNLELGLDVFVLRRMVQDVLICVSVSFDKVYNTICVTIIEGLNESSSIDVLFVDTLNIYSAGFTERWKILLRWIWFSLCIDVSENTYKHFGISPQTYLRSIAIKNFVRSNEYIDNSIVYCYISAWKAGLSCMLATVSCIAKFYLGVTFMTLIREQEVLNCSITINQCSRRRSAGTGLPQEVICY
jgi:hypothetical protein